MKGVILAGGRGTRLLPVTRVTNKHLLPVYDKPMIFYPLRTLIACGIRDIVIVSGREHAGHFLNLLGSGKEFGVDLSYDIQEEAGGIAQALAVVEDFIHGDTMAVILGDNIFERNTELHQGVREFSRKQKGGAKIFLKETDEAQRFGVAEVVDGRVIRVVEKPKHPKSNLVVLGFYVYDSSVFDIIRTLRPSRRGEYEITDVNNAYIKKKQMTYQLVKGDWTDAGTFPTLLRASMLAANSAVMRNGVESA